MQADMLLLFVSVSLINSQSDIAVGHGYNEGNDL